MQRVLKEGNSMAIIHRGRNTLQEKLDSFYEETVQHSKKYFYERIEDQKASYEREKAAFRRSVPVKLLFLLLAIALILLLVRCPEIIQRIQEAAHDLFSGLENSLRDAMSSSMTNTSEGIGEILLNILLSFLSLIAAVLIWLLRVSSGVLVILICFSIPICIAFFSVKGLIPRRKPSFDGTFDEDAARKRVRLEPLPNEMNILQTGLEGEEAALQLLSRLGNDCHIYTNLQISYDGNKSETDIIVVAPHAVTIVEVKNYKDEPAGDWSDEHLVVEAERGQTIHRHEVYNPVRQVATHAYRLSNYLRENGAAATVNRCVLFVNSSLFMYKMEDANNALQHCPVFLPYQLEYLLDYLQEPQQRTSGSRVVKLLNELIAQQV